MSSRAPRRRPQPRRSNFFLAKMANAPQNPWLILSARGFAFCAHPTRFSLSRPASECSPAIPVFDGDPVSRTNTTPPSLAWRAEVTQCNIVPHWTRRPAQVLQLPPLSGFDEDPERLNSIAKTHWIPACAGMTEIFAIPNENTRVVLLRRFPVARRVTRSSRGDDRREIPYSVTCGAIRSSSVTRPLF
jgi:hypothetical protein